MKINLKHLILPLVILYAMSLAAQTPDPDRPPGRKSYPHYIRPSAGIPMGQAKQLLRERFNMRSSDELRSEGLTADPLQYTHQRFQQYYRGVKVDDAVCTVHAKDGLIYMISGNYRDIPDVDVGSRITPQAAFNKAVGHVGATRYIWEVPGNGGKPPGELVILADAAAKNPARLAYKYDIYALEPLSRAEVFVDAHTGAYITSKQRLHTTDTPASGTSLYNGTVPFTADFTGSGYRLRQKADGGGIETYDMNNGTNYGAASDVTSSSTNFTSDDAAVQAHWGAEKTHQYFIQKHNRNSFDNGGAVIRSYVHYAGGYVNAFWDGQRVTFGDGDGINYSPLVSVDIVAHEIAHGVTDFSADLIYSYESGALNESFSDIFGEVIERYATGTNDWQVGADIRITGSGGIRSMNNPKSKGDPDTYQGTYWYNGSGDNGGVHINSGVQNKWFHILTLGEAGTNDLGNTYNVNGIGMEKAAAIAYRNLTVYLSPTSSYFDAREGAIQAAVDLFGEGSPEEVATTNAWYAVGVGGSYGSTSYCGSGGNNASYEWIAKVAIGPFTHTSGGAGYSDFTAQTAELSAGQSYAVSLTPGFSGEPYFESWKIWIDYNADGDFNDSGELVFGPGELTQETMTGTITIPVSASGSTRMRVSMKWNGEAGPCEYFGYGEVEDYTVSFGEGGDSEPPSAPTNLSVSQITESSARLSWSASTDNKGVIGYEVYLDGAISGSTANTFYDFSGLAPATTYTLSVRAMDAAGNRSGYKSISATTADDPGDSGTYCSSEGENHTFEWIAGVTVGAFSNTSGASGYSDFTAKTISLSPGQSSQIQLQPGFSSTAYDEYWRLWIDYNADGDFSDAGELAFDAGTASKNTVSGTIVVPAGASGTTRLRVAMRWNNPPSACGTFSYGEVEDYTVRFEGGGGEDDSQAPSKPGNLVASNITQTSAALSWTASTDNKGVTAYEVFVDGVLKGTTSQTTYTVSGLSPATSYTMSVRARDAAGNRSASASVGVLTLPDDDPGGPSGYCESKGQSASFEWIAKVSIGGFTNTSGAAGYTDFTSKTISLGAGQSYSVNLTPGFAASKYDEYWRIWIDYNADGDFNDAGELAFDAGSASENPVSGTIDIPSNASGTSRLRVSMKWGTASTACETFPHGEVEDYSVQFGGGGGGDTQAPAAPGNLTASNTTQSSTLLSWTAPTDNVGVTGYEIFVDGSLAGTTTNTSFTVSGLSPATAYTMAVKARDAAGNRSAASSVLVTTLGGGGSEVLFGHYFENGWDGWSKGGNDVKRYSGEYSYEGNFSVRLRDGSGEASAMTSSVYDVSGYTQLEINFHFLPNSMEAGESFRLMFHDGSSWKTVASFISEQDFENMNFYEGAVTLSSSEYNFPANARFRFQCDANSNFDHVYIDAIVVTGNASANLRRTEEPSLARVQPMSNQNRPLPGIADPVIGEKPVRPEITLYPNPAVDFLNVRMPADAGMIQLLSLDGKVLRTIEATGNVEELDVSGLSPGLYLISVRTGEKLFTKQFLKH